MATTHKQGRAVSEPDQQARRQDEAFNAAHFYLIAGVAALGGLLFGYDTGVISGAELFLVKTYGLTSFTEELAVSAVLIGAILGALTSGKIADAIGRRGTLIALAGIFGAGAILTAISPSFALFVIFRIVVGYGVGGASVVAPMYTSELAPPEKRGSMVFLFQLAVTIGIAVAYWVDLGFSNAGMGWRPMFAVAVIPAVLLGGGMFFLQETPRWLATKGKWDDARKLLHEMIGQKGDEELDQIRESLHEEEHVGVAQLVHGTARKALIIAVGLAILQQFVGINTIIYYAPTIFGYAGMTTANVAILATTVVGVLNVLATIVAIFLVDRIGRRVLLLSGLAGMAAALVLTGLLFQIGPSSAGGLLLGCLILYVVSFAIGMGPVFWLMTQEVFPTRFRGMGAGLAAMANWSSNLVISISFLSLIAVVGRPGTFWIYAGFAVVAFIFSLKLVPETKGKRLEDVEQALA